MTNASKSKKTKVWVPIFVGVLIGFCVPFETFSQSLDDNRPFGELGIRGSIDEANEPQGDTDLQEDDETPVELGRIVTNTPVRRVQPAGPVGTTPGELISEPRTSQAVDPVQTGTTPVDEQDPFAATGFRMGNTEVRMSLEQSFGYSSNVSQNGGGEDGAFSRTDAALSFSSDWSRHQWQTNFNGSFRKPFDGDATDDISFSADTELRLDMIDGLALVTSGSYSASRQEFTSTTLAPGAVDTPLTQSYGGGVELERADRKLQFSITGSVQRNIFEDADLGGGLTQSQEDQNNNLYSLGLRAGYEMSPVLTPFVEGIYSIRDYDLEVDRNGNRRDSDIFELRAGVEVGLGERAQGEISVGYLSEQFDDPLLDDLTGFTLNGSLNWSPERDSQITLTLGTQTNNSITANENGSLLYNARLDYARQINDRLTFDAFTGVQVETNDDRNTTFEIGTGLQYWVNRFVAVTGDVEYTSFNSGAANSSFDEVSARIGMRLQR